MPTILSLRQTKIVVILLSVAITLLLLRNKQISLYQSLNFILFPSNHPESGTILFSMTTCLFYTASTGAVNIPSVVSVFIVSFEVFSLMILNNPSCSENAFKSFSQC